MCGPRGRGLVRGFLHHVSSTTSSPSSSLSGFQRVVNLNIPLLCVTTPLFCTSSTPNSSINLPTAWNAPRTLNAPMRWKFSALKNSRNFGFAGVSPAHWVPCSASGVCGVDARVVNVVLVRMGVRWMCGLIISWAARTEARVSGREEVF